jgi:tetratricopeptide (TPR) repeat protein
VELDECLRLQQQNAASYGERALALARELDLREQIAFTLNDIAGWYWVLGRFDRAKESAREARALWRELGNLPMLADSLHVATQISIRIGEYDQAIALSAEAFQISQSSNNVWGQTFSRFRLGYVYWERGQIEQAITIMEETIRQSEAGGFLVPQVVTRTELAAVYGSLGKTDRGLELVRLALTIASEQMPLYRAFVLGILAQLQLLNDNIAEAKEAMDLAQKDPSREAWPVYFVSVRLADSWLDLKLGDCERALAVTDDLLADLRQYGMRSEIPRTLYLHSQALLGLGQDEAARNGLQEAYAEAEAIGSRRMLWQILFALSQLETDPVEAQRLRRQAQEIIEYIANHISYSQLRTSFLALPQVQAVFEARDSEL